VRGFSGAPDPRKTTCTIFFEWVPRRTGDEKLSDEDGANQSPQTWSMFLAGRGRRDFWTSRDVRSSTTTYFSCYKRRDRDRPRYVAGSRGAAPSHWQILVDTATTTQRGRCGRRQEKLVGRALKFFASVRAVVSGGRSVAHARAHHRLQLKLQFRVRKDARGYVTEYLRKWASRTYTASHARRVRGSAHRIDVVDIGLNST